MNSEEFLNTFKQLFSDKLNRRINPSIITKEIAENIYYLELCTDSYKIMKKEFKNYLKNSNLHELNLRDVVMYFTSLHSNLNSFFLESRILCEEINECIFMEKDVLQKRDFLRIYFFKRLRDKIYELEEQIITNMLKIIKQKTEVNLMNDVLSFLKEFKVYNYFFGKLSKKNVQILRKENFFQKINKEKKICVIYNTLRREKKRFLIQKFYRKMEGDFLKKYFKFDVEDLFSFKKKSLEKFFKLVEKSKRNEEFYKKLNDFLEIAVNFDEFCYFILKIKNFKEVVDGLHLNDKFKNEVVNEISNSLEKFILTHEKSFINELAESIREKDLDYLKIVTIFFKYCTDKEEFGDLLGEVFGDLLLSLKTEKLEKFLSICDEEKIGKNCIFKLENMLIEIQTKKMCKKSEITTISSVFWPKFRNDFLDFPELENIKSKFLVEEKRKNPKIKYEFNDIISLCEIFFNGSKLTLTLIQYKIMLIINETDMTYQQLKSYFNTEFFDENFRLLIENKVILETDGLLTLTSNPIDSLVIPSSFPRIDLEKQECQEKTSYLLIDAKVMSIMKKEKRMKEQTLRRKIKENKLEERVDLLVEKGYLKRADGEIIYNP